jgi:hypothetical protein
MESFIVRVYRRSRTIPGEMAGLVETVGTDERRAFQSIAGLIRALQNAILSVSDTGSASASGHAGDGAYTTPGEKRAQ